VALSQKSFLNTIDTIEYTIDTKRDVDIQEFVYFVKNFCDHCVICFEFWDSPIQRNQNLYTFSIV